MLRRLSMKGELEGWGGSLTPALPKNSSTVKKAPESKIVGEPF
jgi:hypothetical protein